MKMDPNDFNILVDLYKSGKIKEVEKGAKSLVKKFPKEIILHNLLGAVYLEMKELDLAEEFFNKAIEIMPEYAEGLNNLGNVYRLKQKPKEALLFFNRALKLSPDFADAHNNIGIVYKENDDFEKAKFHYKKSIELKPGSPDPYNNIGNLFKDSGMLDEAIKNFEIAIQLNQNFFEAYNNLALTYQKKKLFKKAEKLFLKAIEILPDFKEAKYNLGYLYLTCENFKEGWKWHEYRKAKSLLIKRHELDYNKEWDGIKFEGKLLVIGEQGLGDQVMYASIFNDLIKKCLFIEKELGRSRNKKNEPRICDIDIIDYNKEVVKRSKNHNLTIPHPKMHKRNFVLLPLFEIAKKWVHPSKKTSIKDLINALSATFSFSFGVL